MLVQKEGSRVAFRDNDGLAALLSIELKADLLVLLTDVDGLFDGPPNDPKSNFIPTYCPEVHDELIKFGDPSAGGRGGMVSKVFCLSDWLSVCPSVHSRCLFLSVYPFDQVHVLKLSCACAFALPFSKYTNYFLDVTIV